MPLQLPFLWHRASHVMLVLRKSTKFVIVVNFIVFLLYNSINNHIIFKGDSSGLTL